MSTDNYSNYKTYDDQPDYFADKAEAQEKWEEWWLDWIQDKGNLDDPDRIDKEGQCESSSE